VTSSSKVERKKQQPYTRANVHNKPTKAKRNPRKLWLTSYNNQHELQISIHPWSSVYHANKFDHFKT